MRPERTTQEKICTDSKNRSNNQHNYLMQKWCGHAEGLHVQQVFDRSGGGGGAWRRDLLRYVSVYHLLDVLKVHPDPEYVSFYIPVWVKGAGVPGQTHVVLHLQCSVLFLLADVSPLQLLLGFQNAPQHLSADTLFIHLH